MKNSEAAKTLTASLPHEAQTLFAWIADPENLPRWHISFCRSLRRENGFYVADTPRGRIQIRLIRNDHALVLDLLAEVAEGIEMTHALRVLPNGEGSELIWTLINPDGVPEPVFHEQIRWAGSALQTLRQIALSEPPTRGEAPSIPSSDPTHAPEELDVESTEVPSTEEPAAAPSTGKKLFIGNLSYAWTDDQLRAHFIEQGTIVTAEVARFRGRNGRSRGFGFVEMSTESEAQSAIEKLHGTEAGGRQIIVRLAKSQEQRPLRHVPSTSESTPKLDRPEPGNERISRAAPRRQRPERSRRTARAHANPAPRTYVEQDITNKSGYEIFPRRSAGASSSEPLHRPPARHRANVEPSPYMDDTGDIENRGRRPPHRRRRS